MKSQEKRGNIIRESILLKKIAIEKLCIKSQERKQFWTNILSAEKKDKNSRPVINLKKKKKKKKKTASQTQNRKKKKKKRSSSYTAISK